MRTMQSIHIPSFFKPLAIIMAFSCIVMGQQTPLRHHHTHHSASHGKITMNQKKHAMNFIMATGALGVSSYYGDICEQWQCYKFRHSIAVGGYYRIDERFSAGGNIFWSRLSNRDRVFDQRAMNNSDNWSDNRNLSFRTDILEFSGYGMFDIIPFDNDFKRRVTLEPYLHLGIGVFYYNPMTKLDGKFYALHKYDLEGKDYSRVSVSIPFGFGVRDKIAPDMNIGIQFGYRLTFTDYIDDVSQDHFEDPNTFDDPIAQQLSDRSIGWKRPPEDEGHPRGNPKRNDGYFVFSIRFEYMIKAFTGHGLGAGRNINRVFEPKHFKKRH